MSEFSRTLHAKAPSPNGSGRPRLYGKITGAPRFDLTEFQNRAHKANAASPTKKTAGAFGGCSLWERKRRKALKSKSSPA